MYHRYLIDRRSGAALPVQLAPEDKGKAVSERLFGRALKRRARLITEGDLLMAPTLLTHFRYRHRSMRIISLLLRYQTQAANRSRPSEHHLKPMSHSTIALRVKKFRQANPNQWGYLPYYRLPDSIVVDRGQEH